jgi:hypothetical protein
VKNTILVGIAADQQNGLAHFDRRFVGLVVTAHEAVVIDLLPLAGIHHHRDGAVGGLVGPFASVGGRSQGKQAQGGENCLGHGFILSEGYG